jgi:hypothetical protein
VLQHQPDCVRTDFSGFWDQYTECVHVLQLSPLLPFLISSQSLCRKDAMNTKLNEGLNVMPNHFVSLDAFGCNPPPYFSMQIVTYSNF